MIIVLSMTVLSCALVLIVVDFIITLDSADHITSEYFTDAYTAYRSDYGSAVNTK